ncbi:MAG: tetratricopeptide repeat protein [Gemmatimonadaceae bacterium]
MMARGDRSRGGRGGGGQGRVDDGLNAAERAVLKRLDDGGDSGPGGAAVRPIPTLYWKRGGARRAAGELLPAAVDFRAAAHWLERLYGDDMSCGSAAPGWLRVQALGAAGECLVLAGRHEAGEPLFEAALDALGDYRERCGGTERARTRQSLGWLHASLSECLRETGDPARALREAELALELGEDAGWRVSLGLALQALGRHAEAITAFDRAMALQPSLTALPAHIARSREALATDHVDNDAPMNPRQERSLEALLEDAERREDAGDSEGAEALLDQLIERAPELDVGWYRRGMLRLFEREAYAEALSDLTRAEELDVTSNGVPRAQLDFVIGEALFGVGRYDDARLRLRNAVAAEEDPVLQAEIYYRLAECADELEREDELREALAAFVERSDAFLGSGGEESQVEWARERLAELGDGR